MLAAILPGSASAALTPQPYGTNDGRGFRMILPPGTNGFANAAELIAFQGTGTRPPHNQDQLGAYRDLVYDYPRLTSSNLEDYFHDATFGVRPADVERTYSPRGDVTVQRDALGVPHVYGETRRAAMFGLGYVGAEDRLFFMDALRHAGRGELSELAGGANVSMDESV
jgi:hypothetical protein